MQGSRQAAWLMARLEPVKKRREDKRRDDVGKGGARCTFTFLTHIRLDHLRPTE
jgi:hypothetical protein